MHYDKDRGDRVTDQFINEKDSHELLRHLTYFE